MDIDSDEEQECQPLNLSNEQLPLQIVSFFYPHNQVIPLSNQHYYRYISPNSKQKGLESFYGDDRSFCIGQVFDTSDFIVEFQFNQQMQLSPITHHQKSYRGPLKKHQIKITAIYYLNSPIDCNSQQFVNLLKSIHSQVPIGTLFYEVDSYIDAESVEIIQITQKQF